MGKQADKDKEAEKRYKELLKSITVLIKATGADKKKGKGKKK